MRISPSFRHLITRRFFIKLVVACVLATSTLFIHKDLSGHVTRVHDGDTITIRTKDNRSVKIRLYGIDCPEIHQQSGVEAKAFTEKLVLSKNVTYTIMDKDQYGRVVAIVTLETGQTLNEALLKQGYAWFYKKHCKASMCSRWKKSSTEARRAKKGLWAKEEITPPWVWRKQQ